MLLGRHQLTRHDSARRLVRDSVTSSSEYPGLLQKLPIHSSTPIRQRQPASATRQARRQQALSDDHSEVEPLLPIPNRNVKRFCADDSGPAPVKVGHRQTSPLQKKPVRRTGFFVEDPGQGRSLRPAGLAGRPCKGFRCCARMHNSLETLVL